MNNYDAGIEREKMLAAFTDMIKPARIIANFSRKELAERSGLSAELIADVEDGLHRFHEAHYLALAAVFDGTKYSEDASIYRAVLRILTPEDELIQTVSDDDFVLVRRWLATFSMENGSDDGFNDEISDDAVVDIEDLIRNSDIYADVSASENRNFQAFINRIEPLLKESDRSISVPLTVMNELSEDMEISTDEEEKLNLAETLEYIRAKSDEGIISIREPIEGFENTEDILEALSANASANDRITIITQEFELAEDLASGRPGVTTTRINDSGDLTEWKVINHD